MISKHRRHKKKSVQTLPSISTWDNCRNIGKIDCASSAKATSLRPDVTGWVSIDDPLRYEDRWVNPMVLQKEVNVVRLMQIHSNGSDGGFYLRCHGQEQCSQIPYWIEPQNREKHIDFSFWRKEMERSEICRIQKENGRWIPAIHLKASRGYNTNTTIDLRSLIWSMMI